MGIIKYLAGSAKSGKLFFFAPTEEERRYPEPDDLIEEFGCAYKGRDGNDLKTDIYRPKEAPEDKLPVIVLVHGGGLFGGRPIMERSAAGAFARKGYIVFVPSYRLLNEADACAEISDICAALDYAKSRASELGGDPDSIYVIGESAGAYLSVYATAMTGSEKLREQIAYEAPDAKIKGIALVSGMFYTTRKDLLGLVYPKDMYGGRTKDREFMELMDPENPEVIGNLPPAILTTSKNDFLKKNTIDYAEALKAAGRDFRLLYFAEKDKRLVHAFVTIYPELPESIDAIGRIDDWFRSHR